MDRDHAIDLLLFALAPQTDDEQNTIPGKFFHKIWLQTVHAQAITNKRENSRLINNLIDDDGTKSALMDGFVDLCVVVDLCRPHKYWRHIVSIYNGVSRSHSNLSDSDSTDEETSELTEQTDVPLWCPHHPLDQNTDGLDSVVIRIESKYRQPPESKWHRCIEGVAVEATGPVCVAVSVGCGDGWLWLCVGREYGGWLYQLIGMDQVVLRNCDSIPFSAFLFLIQILIQAQSNHSRNQQAK